jgi:dephospho-CoA kinase
MINDTLRAAVQTFGGNAQKLKAVEEMAELTKELCKDLNGQGSPAHIAEEIADVEIMLEQLKYIYSNTALVYAYRKQKIERLQGRITEARKC